MSGATIIAVIALVASAVSVVVAAFSLKLESRESRRRDDEIRMLREEAGRREEELNLMRQQFAAEREERRAQLRAHLIARAGAASSSASGIEFDLTVKNAGPHHARDVGVMLTHADGMQVGGTVGLRALLPGEEDVAKLHGLPKDVAPHEFYRVWIEWNDGLGYKREETGLRLSPP